MTVRKTKTEVVEADLAPLSTLRELAVLADRDIVHVPRTTVASRREQLLADLEDDEALPRYRRELDAFIDLITSPLGEDPVLTEEYAYTLVKQAVAVRQLADLAEVCKTKIKEVLFQHLNAYFAEEGHDDPEHINGILEVAELGMKLSREGSGYSDPVIDEEKLKKGLGPLWERVYTHKVIPATETWELDLDALWELVKARPKLLEKVRDALKPGKPKSARMNLRNM